MSKLITGVAIGVLLGILIAPDKGSETRRKLSEKGKDLKDQFNDFVDTIAEKIDSLRGEAEELVDSPREPYTSQPYSVG
jgi:gas vesicle protein